MIFKTYIVIKKIKQYKYNFKLKQLCKINNMFVGIFKNSFKNIKNNF